MVYVCGHTCHDKCAVLGQFCRIGSLFLPLCGFWGHQLSLNEKCLPQAHVWSEHLVPPQLVVLLAKVMEP